MGISRRAMLTGAVALPVLGCTPGEISFVPESEVPTPTESVDPAIVVDPEYFVRSKEASAKRLDEGVLIRQRISTPHFDGKVEANYVGPRLDAATVAQVGESEAVKAPDGYELIAITLRAGQPAFVPTQDHPVDIQLRIGEAFVPVENLFGQFMAQTAKYLTEWEMFVFTAPLGAPVLLEVSDEGKTVGFDLREGIARLDDAWNHNAGFRQRYTVKVEPRSGVFTREVTTQPPEGVDAQSARLDIGLAPIFAQGPVPWVPSLGWAELGTQWLAADMNAIAQSRGEFFPRLKIDVPESFTYQDDDGTKHPAVAPNSVMTDALARKQSELRVVWNVSGRDTQAFMSFNPVGPMVVDYTDLVNVPATFSTAAVPLEFLLTYTESDEPT